MAITYHDLYLNTRMALTGAGIEAAQLEARELICAAAGKTAEELYREMGRVFQPSEGRSYYIISPHEHFEKLFGRAASRRRKLYNGMIKCQLYMFY